MEFAAHFSAFAQYNAWANGRLYDAVAALPEAEYRRERQAFFGSIHGTLNHILVADRAWLKRITGEGEAPDRLDAILHDDFAALRAAREAEDARFLRFTEGRADADYERWLEYRNYRGEPFSQPLAEVLAHVFNHQTHHRGQVHNMLSQILRPSGTEPPELDLIYFLRQRGG